MTIHLSRAEGLLAQRRPEQAIAEIQQHLSIFPEDPIAYASLARAETLRGRQKEAIDHSARAIHLGPDIGYCHYIRAWVLDRFDREKEAEASAMESLRIDPFSPEYYSLLGFIRLGRANWRGALEAAEAGLAIDAAHVECVNVRATALMRLGQKDNADSAIRGALANDPENPRSLANQGWICLNSGRREEAIGYFREALRIDPTLESARLGLLEALRNKYALYRALYGFYDWMGGFGSGARRGIIVGIYIASRIISAVGQSNPALMPLAIVFSIVYGAFVFLTWTGRSTFDILVRFHPLGRLALTRQQRSAATWVGICLLCAGISVTLGFAINAASPVFAAICFALLGIPVSRLASYKGDLWKTDVACVAACLCIAALEVTGLVVTPYPGWLDKAFYGIMGAIGLYSWIRLFGRQ